MKSTLLTLTCILAGYLSVSGQDITTIADFPAAGRFGAVAFTIDSIAYAGLGETGAEQYPKQFFSYNSRTDTWTEIAPFPGPGREYAVSFTLDGKGYVGLGFSLSGVMLDYYKDFYRYDPVTNAWTHLKDFGGEGRVKAVAFVADSIPYAGTGSNAGQLLNDFWKYNKGTDTWTLVSGLSTAQPMHGAAAAVVRDKAYLIGGRGNGGVYFDQILEFDPAAGTAWVAKKQVPGLTLESGAAFALNHAVYFGYGGNSFQLQKFDPEQNAVEDFGSLPDLESIDRGPVAFSIDSTEAYFGLGYASVVANQQAAYQRGMWRLEVQLTSGIEKVTRTSSMQIIPSGAGHYYFTSDVSDPVELTLATLSGVPFKSVHQLYPGEDFFLSAPTGVYVATLVTGGSDMHTELIFHTGR